MTEQEMLQAMESLLDKKFKQELQPIHEKLDIIQENVEINRHTGNLLLKWAEKAERSVNVGLYE